MESNPAFIINFIHAQPLRKTKNTTIYSPLIARWLMTVNYDPNLKVLYLSYLLIMVSNSTNILTVYKIAGDTVSRIENKIIPLSTELPPRMLQFLKLV